MLETKSCKVCGKPLVAYPCLQCGESGKIRKWIFKKEVCPSCKGSRKHYRCPDEFKHLTRNQHLTNTSLTQNTYKPQTLTCPTCGQLIPASVKICPNCAMQATINRKRFQNQMNNWNKKNTRCACARILCNSRMPTTYDEEEKK